MEDLNLEITRGKSSGTLQDSGINNNFLNRTPIVQEIRARHNKLKSTCSAKDTVPEQETPV
jgi:hypothetical protein